MLCEEDSSNAKKSSPVLAARYAARSRLRDAIHGALIQWMLVLSKQAHLIIERAHDGPRLLQTFETHEEAEEGCDEFTAENPEMVTDLYVVIAKAVASTRHPGG